MPSYLTPGVYIEELKLGPRTIEGVGTSTAGFVGIAPDAAAHLNAPVAITNWSQFVREYAPPGSASTPLSHAVFGFFLNGGQLCYVVNVGADGSLTGDASGRKGLDVLETVDAVAIVAAPGFADAGSYDAVLSHCERLKDRVAVLDAPAEFANLDLFTRVASAGVTGTRRRREGGDAAAPAADAGGQAPGLRPRVSDGGYGALYIPHIITQDPLNPKERVAISPSGHIAGIYARTDAERGVHKAPANEVIRGALGVTYAVTHAEQGQLNLNGVNVIRAFDDSIRVWGARTVAGPGSEWRYVNVRRLFAFIEESIQRSTRWCVFEPNDVPLWNSIVRDVRAFLTLLWRQGALMGATPEEAFFVKCDRETNPPDVVDAGQVVTIVGVAPVKPAEFVIFRIGQSAGGAEIEEGRNG
ncbi:MAG TPA: phage tail sheath subtilisin-like domain-containing protein [Thermoanaerobaculia bacterium]